MPTNRRQRAAASRISRRHATSRSGAVVTTLDESLAGSAAHENYRENDRGPNDRAVEGRPRDRPRDRPDDRPGRQGRQMSASGSRPSSGASPRARAASDAPGGSRGVPASGAQLARGSAVDEEVRAQRAQPSSAAPEAAGAKTIKPLDIAVPARIDRYVIGSRIGSGTCGIVHKALDERLGREVAIKLSPVGEAHVSTGKVPGAQRAYQTEIVAAGRLTHPNIVTVFDAGTAHDLNFLVMEVIEGRSLKEFGKGKALLPVHRALSVIADCCRALDYSHARGILHRDIKPANVMLGSEGTVKLLDFGIAVGLDGETGLDRSGPTLGTPNYMSPEQILGRELTPESDFYSLSTVLFELLTGRQLFKAKKVKELFRIVVHQPAPRLDALRPDLPEALADVVAKGLSKAPAERFTSGESFAAALQPFIERYRIVEERPAAQRRFIRALQQQTFFLEFPDVEIAQLLELVKVRTFRAGEALLAPGSGERRLLVLTDGIAKVTENGDLLGVVGEGDSVGEAGFINGIPEPRRVQALTTVNALEISADALSDLPPKVHLHYYRSISDRLAKRLAREGRLDLDFLL